MRDFNKATATTFTAQLSQINVPVVLVIKKNSSTLKNLLEWLKEHSVHQSTQMVSQPMLLIDDEADNASINTAYQRDEVTRINSQIRELLSLFHRSCYVGYTATPFANIFIDPDTDDEALKQDLFPRDFIIGLDAPSNYFGAQKIFLDARDQHIRLIDDNEDVLPMKHKIDHPVDVLPGSLVEAVRAFVVARAIRNARGQQAGHASMLVNASRFTDVQGRLRSRIADVLARQPGNGTATYYAGLGQAQIGRADRAFPLWRRLWEDSPDGAPWLQVLEVELPIVAREAGVRYEMPQRRGPSAADIAAASEMSAEDRAEMIRGMVNGLSERLATDGGPPPDWARLITALGVLGETDRAHAIAAEAREVFADDAGALAVIADAEARLP